MSRNDIIDLLTLAGAYDYRTVGEADVQAWLTIATECGWTFDLARRCVIEHYKRQADRGRVTPGHITDRIDAARDAIRKHVLKTDIVPPRDLGDDPAAEIAWRRRFTAEFVDRALAAWAAGDELPVLDPAVVSTERTAGTAAARQDAS